MRQTIAWIDPVAGITAGFFTSTQPFFDPPVIEAVRSVEQACYRSVGR